MAETVISRRWSAIGLVAGLTVVLVGGWMWVPWADGPWHVTPVPAAALFSAPEIATAESFSSAIRIPSLLSLGIALAALLAIALHPRTRRLIDALAHRWPWWLVTGLSVVAVRLVVWLATLPTDLWARHLMWQYGLTRQPLSGWLLDRTLSGLTTVAIDIIIVGVLVGTARAMPRSWPLVAGAILAGLVFVGSFVYPVVVEPMFNRFTPLQEGPLRQQILHLADREGVAVDDVLVADASRRTTTINAYVSGFGSTRRVVLYDTLLTGVPRRQVLVVVAHELAHARHQDVLKGTALGAAGAFAGVCLLGVAAGGVVSRRSMRTQVVTWVPALLALVAVASLAVAPAVNAASRAVELRADADSLETTGNPTAFLGLQRNLALKSLADPTPPRLLYWWFATHPTALERAALVSSKLGPTS